MKTKAKEKIKEAGSKLLHDESAMGGLLIGFIVMVVAMLAFFGIMLWLVLTNLETIGMGLLYIGGAVLAIAAAAVLIKRYVWNPQGEGVGS